MTRGIVRTFLVMGSLLGLGWALAGPMTPQESAPPDGGGSQIPSVTLPAELQRVLSDYEAAWLARDAAALAALFTEDGIVMARGRPPVQGRPAIEALYRGSGGPLALRAFAYATAGDVGYILGGYAGQRGQPDDGKFTLTLRRGPDGSWLIRSDMDNGNR